MKIALLAEHASTNVPLKRSLKATSTKLILKFAQIAEHVQMCVRLKQFTRHNASVLLKNKKAALG